MSIRTYRVLDAITVGPILLAIAYGCFRTHVDPVAWVATTLACLFYLNHFFQTHRLVTRARQIEVAERSEYIPPRTASRF